MSAKKLMARFTRRDFLKGSAGGVCAAIASKSLSALADEPFRLNYILGSSMYGELPLAEILPEVHKAGATHIDIWPRVHGNQREQIEEMGHEKFREMLAEYNISVGILTRYDLGLARLKEEFPFAQQFGCRIIVTASGGPKGLAGDELKSAMQKWVEQIKPLAANAERHGVSIAIENHASSLVDSPDSIRWLGEMTESLPVGIALAPYHLPQDVELIGSLIRGLGPKLLHFYAWEHGKGCFDKLPKEEEMLQLPGYGSLDFEAIIAALKAIKYSGWTEVFMHPVPRGIPILPTAPEVTAAINRSRRYLDECASRV